MEIERKYLVAELPKDLESYPSWQISQSYLMREPTVRVRQMGERYYLTVKGEGVIARQEFEMEITCGQYSEQLEKTQGYPVTKVRYHIPIGGGLTAELDIFSGRLEGLVTVEVEFENLEACDSFKKPAWFGEDVSLSSRYRNGHLSLLEKFSAV